MIHPILLVGAAVWDFKRQMNGKNSLITSPGAVISNCLRKGNYEVTYYKGVAHKRERCAPRLSLIPSLFARFLIDLIVGIGINLAFKYSSLSRNYILKLICCDIYARFWLFIPASLGLLTMSAWAVAEIVRPELRYELKAMIEAKFPIKKD